MEVFVPSAKFTQNGLDLNILQFGEVAIRGRLVREGE